MYDVQFVLHGVLYWHASFTLAIHATLNQQFIVLLKYLSSYY